MFKLIIQAIVNSVVFLAILLIFIAVIIKLKYNKKEVVEIDLKKAKKVLIDSFESSYDVVNTAFSKKSSIYEYIDALKYLEEDDKIEEIILDIDELDLSFSNVEELEKIFSRLRKKKKVIAIASEYSNKSYLVSLLAEKIYLLDTRNSIFSLRAYGKIINYYKSFFDKLGLKFNAIHIGSHKSAGENFSRDSISKENKESLFKIYNGIFDIFNEKLKNRRNVYLRDEILKGDLLSLSSKEAIDLNLIDGTSNFDKLGIDLEKDTISFSGYISKYKRKKNKSKNSIAVISLEGTILPDNNKENISLENVSEKLDILEEVSNLKGLVLKINSPGGSALESELIVREIKNRVDVPIFVSMGEVCASGGYYISTVARKIYALESTITGSIGVVALRPDFSGSLEKLGINPEKSVDLEGYDMDNLLLPLSKKSEENIVKVMEEIYLEFKLRVIRSRYMSMENLEKIAQGQIWLGKQAKEINLVDNIGTVEDTIKGLVNYLRLEDYKLVNITRKLDIKEAIEEKVDKYSKYFKVQEIISKYNGIMYTNEVLLDWLR